MKEIIMSRQFGGKWWKFICCHEWETAMYIDKDILAFEKLKCVDCGCTENNVILDWSVVYNPETT